MSKQTSTALKVNVPFSGDNVHPQHGAIASQEQVAMKSDSTSAGAAQPSRPAAVGTPIASWSAMTIHIGSSGFTPSSTSVAPGDSVTLKYDLSGSINVYTEYAGKSSAVFGGTCPYAISSTGTTYTVPYLSGPITLKAGGTTGTINVGGGTACPPCDEGGEGHERPPHSRS